MPISTQTHGNFDVGELLDHLYAKEAYKPWDRSIGVYHPSSIKGCKRALYYDRISEPPKRIYEAETNAIFEMGHGLHARVQEQYARHPGFQSEVKAHIPELHIGGSVDGVFTVEGWVLEIKSIGEASFRTCVKPKEEHLWQMHCYMMATKVLRAQLLYVNRNNGQKRVFRVQFDQNIWDKILAIIAIVEAAVKTKVPPEQEINKYYCRTCKFLHVCKPALDGKPLNAPLDHYALAAKYAPAIPIVQSVPLARTKLVIRRRPNGNT